MTSILHMEYKALNLLDEVCSVELAIMDDKKELHILDCHKAISPIYNFSVGKYKLNDDFYQMVRVLMKKKILFSNNCGEMSIDDWLDRNTIFIYSDPSKVFKNKNSKLDVIELKQNSYEENLYLHYVNRIGNYFK